MLEVAAPTLPRKESKALDIIATNDPTVIMSQIAESHLILPGTRGFPVELA